MTLSSATGQEEDLYMENNFSKFLSDHEVDAYFSVRVECYSSQELGFKGLI